MEPGKSAYGASKAALITMKIHRGGVGEKGIRANCIAPGITDTDMLLTMPAHVVKKQKIVPICDAQVSRQKLQRRHCSSQAISSYITGQTIRIDGGLK
jgi:3-oxoacyl-[acyl-carrier protein] reductase